MPLKTSPIIKTPDIGKIQDQATKMVLEQLIRFIFDNQRNIYDDLKALNTMSSGLMFGDGAADGSWRFIVIGTNISVQRLESGVWVEKGVFTA